MAYAELREPAHPLGDINTTPLIDVLLVLLVMLVITIPATTNTLSFDLPNGPVDPLKPDPVVNKVVLTNDGQMLWNGTAVDRERLRSTLAAAAALSPEPELQFEPEALASYDLSARVLNDIKLSGTTNFGFVGNARYREFGAGN